MNNNKYKVLLGQKKYIRLLLADLVSRFGDSIDAIAYSWIMYEITQSESLMALIIGLNYVPTVIFQPFLGVLVDRMRKKKIMVYMDIIRGGIVAGVIALYSMNALTPLFLCVFTLLTSTVEAIRMPAGSAFLPIILDKEYYTLGKAANYSLSRAVELIGLLLAGWLISVISSTGTLMIDMLSFFISSALIFSINDNEVLKATGKKLSDIVSGFKEGVRFFNSHSIIKVLALIGLLINFGIMPLSVFQTPYVSDYLKMGPEMLSVIKICMVVGMSVGAFIVPKITAIKRSTLAGIAGVIMGITLIMMFVSPQCKNIILKIGICIIAMFFIGFGGGMLNVIIGGCMMESIPKDMMGRISGFISSMMQFSMPIASFICSALAMHISVVQIFMIFGFLTIMVYMVLLMSKKLKVIG